MLAGYQGQWYDAAHVHFWTVHVHVQFEFLADGFDVLQTLLIIGSSTANPYLGLVFVQCGGKFPQCADDTLESCSNLECVVSLVRF